MTKPNSFNKNRNDSKFKPVIESNRDMKEKIMFTGTGTPTKFGRHERTIYSKSAKVK